MELIELAVSALIVYFSHKKLKKSSNNSANIVNNNNNLSSNQFVTSMKRIRAKTPPFQHEQYEQHSSLTPAPVRNDDQDRHGYGQY
jgi:septum formation inhibitor-activating ATPase MinD